MKSLTVSVEKGCGQAGNEGQPGWDEADRLAALLRYGILDTPPGRITGGSVRFRGEGLLGADPERRRLLRGESMATGPGLE